MGTHVALTSSLAGTGGMVEAMAGVVVGGVAGKGDFFRLKLKRVIF
jgi:hypothetical protein